MYYFNKNNTDRQQQKARNICVFRAFSYLTYFYICCLQNNYADSEIESAIISKNLEPVLLILLPAVLSASTEGLIVR